METQQVESTELDDDTPAEKEGWVSRHYGFTLWASFICIGLVGGLFGFLFSEGQHSYSSRSIDVDVTVVKIDPGALPKQYQNVQLGDTIPIKISEEDLSLFQVNQAGIAECMDNGLVLTPFLEETKDGANANYDADCGPIHVVIFPPLG